MHQVVTWTKDVYRPKLASIKKHMETQIEKFSIGSRMQDFVSLSKRFELIDKHLCKLERFLNVFDKENWVMNTSHAEKRGTRKFEFKPVDISPFSENYLFNPRDCSLRSLLASKNARICSLRSLLASKNARICSLRSLLTSKNARKCSPAPSG